MKEDFSRFVDTTLSPEGASVQPCFGDVLLNGVVQDHHSAPRPDEQCKQTGVSYHKYWLADDRVTVDDTTFLGVRRLLARSPQQ